jgi:hypothetical protein
MPDRNRTRPVILAVSSGGGHWVQMQRLAPAFAGADLHYATTDATAAEADRRRAGSRLSRRQQGHAAAPGAAFCG